MKGLIEQIMRTYGVTTQAPRAMGELRPVKGARALVSNAEQEPIGQPGTTVYSGDIDAEPNRRYSPTYVRGSSGSAGLYEEFYRSEPLIYDAVQNHAEVLVSGTVELHVPAEVDERDRERIENFVAFHGARFAVISERYVRECITSLLIFGFSPFEILWGGVGPGERPYIHALDYREPSSVDEWLFSENMSTLLGCEFRTNGDGPTEWTLMAEAPKLTDRRLLLANLNARGNNVEGVSPIRPGLFYVQAKQLLLQISLVTAQKFGVPLALVIADPAYVNGAQMGDYSDADATKIFNALSYRDAVDGHVYKMPEGLTVKFEGPGGTMPSYGDLIAYCDTMIGTPFSVEGSQLGLQQAVGSYALGEVKERDALRSAPGYARAVLEPVNAIMRDVAVAELGEMREYPRLKWRMDGLSDDGQWLDDAVKVFGGPISTWPKAAQAAGLEKLDLPADTFDSTEEAEPEEDADLELSESGPWLLSESSCGCGGACGCGSVDNAEPTQLVDVTYGARAYAEVDGLEAIMDATQDALAASFASIQRQMRDQWRELIRDNTSATDLVADRRALRDQFEPILLEAVIEAMKTAAERSGSAYLEALGSTGSYTLDVDREIELLAVSTADEALGRMIGVMTDSEVERQRGGGRQTISTLAASTLGLLAARVVSSAINRARDSVAQGLLSAATERGAKVGRVMAERSAVLDSNTCATCRDLDGRTAVVGSESYRRLTPPNQCQGRERCRCVWLYRLPLGELARAGVIDAQRAAELDALASVREDR